MIALGDAGVINRRLLGLRWYGLQGVFCLYKTCISLYHGDKNFLRAENRAVDNLAFMYRCDRSDVS